MELFRQWQPPTCSRGGSVMRKQSGWKRGGSEKRRENDDGVAESKTVVLKPSHLSRILKLYICSHLYVKIRTIAIFMEIYIFYLIDRWWKVTCALSKIQRVPDRCVTTWIKNHWLKEQGEKRKEAEWVRLKSLCLLVLDISKIILLQSLI